MVHLLSRHFRPFSLLTASRDRRLLRLKAPRNGGNVVVFRISYSSVLAYRVSFFVGRANCISLTRFILLPFACVGDRPLEFDQAKYVLQGIRSLGLQECVVQRTFLQVRCRVEDAHHVPANDATVTINGNFFIRQRVVISSVLRLQGVRSANNRIHERRRQATTVARLVRYPFPVQLLRASVGTFVKGSFFH